MLLLGSQVLQRSVMQPRIAEHLEPTGDGFPEGAGGQERNLLSQRSSRGWYGRRTVRPHPVEQLAQSDGGGALLPGGQVAEMAWS